jgi:hypothetical protein
LRLTPDDEIPRAVPRDTFTPIGSAEAAELAGAADVLGGRLGEMAGSWASSVDGGDASSLAGASDAHAYHSAASTEAIARVVGSIEGLAGELAGATSDSGRDLNVPDPTVPSYQRIASEEAVYTGNVAKPRDPPPPPSQAVPRDPVRSDLVRIYRGYLANWIRDNFRREPEEAELADVDKVYDANGTLTGELYNDMLDRLFVPRL